MKLPEVVKTIIAGALCVLSFACIAQMWTSAREFQSMIQGVSDPYLREGFQTAHETQLIFLMVTMCIAGCLCLMICNTKEGGNGHV